MHFLRLSVLTLGLWMVSELAGQAEGSVPSETPHGLPAGGPNGHFQRPASQLTSSGAGGGDERANRFAVSGVLQAADEPAKTECCMPW